jgi:hypothetical protein
VKRNFLAKDWSFAAFLTLIFFCCALFNVAQHVMWRDETLTWQFVAASPTLAALHANLRYAAVPMLWYLLIWPLSKVGLGMFSMQFVHVLIASAVVFIFGWGAPISRNVKALFTFGYLNILE